MADGEPVAVLETGDGNSSVRVEFHRKGDLIHHTISLFRKNNFLVVARSIGEKEGQLLNNVPCFTQLIEHERAVMLTGASGPYHWSMSVQVGEVHIAADQQFLTEGIGFAYTKRYGLNAPQQTGIKPLHHILSFEVACRCKYDATMIGSSYHLSDSLQDSIISPNKSCIMFPLAVREWYLFVFGGNPYEQAMKFVPETNCRVSQPLPNELRIRSKYSIPDDYPATVQWSYAVWGG